jgi:hypothetical protein
MRFVQRCIRASHMFFHFNNSLGTLQRLRSNSFTLCCKTQITTLFFHDNDETFSTKKPMTTMKSDTQTSCLFPTFLHINQIERVARLDNLNTLDKRVPRCVQWPRSRLVSGIQRVPYTSIRPGRAWLAVPGTRYFRSEESRCHRVGGRVLWRGCRPVGNCNQDDNERYMMTSP